MQASSDHGSEKPGFKKKTQTHGFFGGFLGFIGFFLDKQEITGKIIQKL